MIDVQVLGGGVNQLVKVRQRTANYKIESKNLMLRKLEEKRMLISNWGIKEGFWGK